MTWQRVIWWRSNCLQILGLKELKLRTQLFPFASDPTTMHIIRPIWNNIFRKWIGLGVVRRLAKCKSTRSNFLLLPWTIPNAFSCFCYSKSAEQNLVFFKSRPSTIILLWTLQSKANSDWSVNGAVDNV